MPKEYIERRLLLDEVEKVMDESEYYGEWEDVCCFYDGDILDAIEKVPTADVQEVRHGEWKLFGYKWECSVCRGRINLDGTPTQNGLNYCPNCGAKMDNY